ncbi:hypothetical protein GALMADRAFT_210556 [Galerina marginata CBS 339.88]|uniref:DUF6533 domain-containing protein n=1 Tax=Galerina marginata (strain CBS 339.88) TaxID=685588 RepID=A0A067T9Q3_GALM3|nr:hypothetical protein GALMADRAFT_210556 [Galerina marginata CBS 339.88]
MSQVTSPAALYSALVELASDNQTTNLSTVATLTWIVYDVIIFFDQEVELIWKCNALPALKVIGPLVLWITADVVWLIRLKALYADKEQAFKWILLFWSIGAAVSTMSIHAVFLALTLYKFRENHVGLGHIRFGAIMSAFIADGILYYVGLVVTTSGGPSIYRIADLSTYWLGGFYSFAGSHLILHLRAVNADPRGLSTVSHPLDFGHRTDLQRSDVESNAVEKTQDGNYRNTGH